MNPWPSRCHDRLFEVLVVAAPGDLLSRVTTVLLALLILTNAAAQGLQQLWPQPHLEVYLLWLQRVSLGLFALEYVARLWAGHADGARSRPSLVRRAIHPLMVVDLLVLLAYLGTLWIQLDLRFLRLLRLPDLLARFSRTLAGGELAEGQTRFAAVQSDRKQALAQVRRSLSEAAQRDLQALGERLAAATADVRAGQRRWLLTARRSPAQAVAAAKETRAQLEALLDTLEDELSASTRLEGNRQAVETAYAETARAYDEVPETAVDERDLRWRGVRSYHEVPVRRIGQHHLSDISQHWRPVFWRFSRAYGDSLRNGLESARMAMGYQFDLAARGRGGVPTAQLQLGLNRAVNRLGDLGEPARAAWEELEWGFETLHMDRLELIETDVGRHGQIEFHLGRVGRGLLRWLQRGQVTGRQLLARLLPAVWRRVTDLIGDLRQLLLPVLEWTGIVRPAAEQSRQEAEQARLQAVLERGLPEDYLTHFRFAPLEEDELLVGFDDELVAIDRAVETWEEGRTSSLLIYGPRGAGKTSLLNAAQRRLFEEDAVVTRDVIVDKITDADALTGYLTRLLDLGTTTDIDSLARALLAGPRRAVILEGCHNLYLRRVGGLGAIRQLLWLVARTNQKVLWGLCLDENAQRYLSKWLPFGRLFHLQVEIAPRSGPELRRLIMRRHNLSGYRLRYAAGPEVARALRRRVGRYRRVEEPNVQEALAGIFFDQLAETCGENATAALFYWLRSLEVEGDDSYSVQPHDPLELDLIRDLSMDAAFALAAILQHDNLKAGELATIVDRNLIDTRLELEILWNSNVVEFDTESGRFRVNAVALKPVQTMLAGRNLIY